LKAKRTSTLFDEITLIEFLSISIRLISPKSMMKLIPGNRQTLLAAAL